MAANQDLSYATKISFIRNRGNFHLQAVNFSSVKELRKTTGSCRNGYQLKGEKSMRKIRKTLHVRARKNSAGGKFQSEMETVELLG